MRSLIRYSMAAATLAIIAACDFKVTNPGPVPAENLQKRETAAGVVNGAGRDLSDALNWLAYTGGAIAREIFPAGSTGSFGISAQQQVGKLLDDDTNNYWQLSQRARYEAESGADVLKTTLGTGFAIDTLAAPRRCAGGMLQSHRSAPAPPATPSPRRSFSGPPTPTGYSARTCATPS